MAVAAVNDQQEHLRPGLASRLAWATVVATLGLIAAGGAVRATDSGLACPDWPACYGQWIPPADLNMWLEHGHRLWAGVVALLVVALVAVLWRRRRTAPVAWRLAVAALVLVVVQAGLGAAVVLLHLRAGLVTSHLVLSFLVVAALIVVAVHTRGPVPGHGSAVAARWAPGLALLILAQAALGSHATGRGAAYVYNAVPWWLAGDPWTGHVREVLHATHRAGGYLVAGAVIAFAVALRRAGAPDADRRLARAAVGLVVLQVGLGLGNVLTQATVGFAVAHLSVASWLWALVVLLATSTRTARSGVGVRMAGSTAND
jgi:heme a synthase